MSFRKHSALAFALALVFCGCAAAPLALDPPQSANLKVGQIFSVRIEPAGRRIEVYVAAANSTLVEFTELHLLADLRVGKKSWFIVPKRVSDHFELSTPSEVPPGSKAELKLLLKTKDKEEILKFQLPEGAQP